MTGDSMALESSQVPEWGYGITCSENGCCWPSGDVKKDKLAGQSVGQNRVS